MSNEQCNICGSTETFFKKELNDYPVTNLFINYNEKPRNASSNISIAQCVCSHLYSTSDLKDIYNEGYGYIGTAPGVKQRRDIGIYVLKKILKDSTLNYAVDIGGGQLEMMKMISSSWKANHRIVIDPVPLRESPSNEDPITFINDYFNKSTIKIEHSNLPNLFILDNVLEHVRDLKELINDIDEISSPQDFIYVCVPSLEGIVSKLQFQEIIHEHINYFSKERMNYLFSQFGYECLYQHTDLTGARGYNFHVFKKSKEIIAQNIMCQNNLSNIDKNFGLFMQYLSLTKEYLERCEQDIYAVCASELTPTLAYFMDTDFSFCKSIIDTSEHKLGKYFPTLVPRIDDMAEIVQDNYESTFFITAPQISGKVIANLNSQGAHNIVLPLPLT